MTQQFFNSCVLFGGTGFIGIHLARHLLENEITQEIFLVDIKPCDFKKCPESIAHAYQDGRIKYIEIDVRHPINNSDLPQKVNLLINLAAIHREPGHEACEYFETNLLGAENICNWAEQVDCNNIIFTSSIAPYGPSEEEKNEKSLPVPLTPYGASKLTAEKIHSAWQKGDSKRRLLIVRPGVVFGPGEGGNVTRLVRAVLGRYFFYMGNKKTRKAGGYIKELCNSLIWALNFMEQKDQNQLLYNFTMNPPPSVKNYVDAICKVADVKRYIPVIPSFFLLWTSSFIEIFARPFRINHPFSPVRIRKLVRSNNIRPSFLVEHGYNYKYTLETALLDWKNENPNDWK